MTPPIPPSVWRRADLAAAVAAHEVGSLLRIVRRHAGMSQAQVGAFTGLSQSDVSEIERGRRQVTDLSTLHRLADGLTMPDRTRIGLGLAPAPESPLRHLVALEDALGGQERLAAELATDIVAGESRRFAAAQTSHTVDLAIGALLTQYPHRLAPLDSWHAAPDPVLRVNAVGVAAKMSDQDRSGRIVDALAADGPVRRRYVTAVLARVLDRPWPAATALAADLASGRADALDEPSVCALVAEIGNMADVGARWCSVWALAGVWAAGGDDATANALEDAVAVEPVPRMRRMIGRALARRPMTV